MTRFWLVRHGPTHARGMVGWTDLPADLSDRAAIARLAAALPASARVISSDLTRAVATADAIQGHRPRLPHDPDLREIRFGVWEMREHAEITAESPELVRAFWTEPGDIRPPGGESWNDLSGRINRALDLLHQRQGGDIVVVAHFGAILAAVQRAAGISAQQALSHRIDNLSLTEIARDGTGWHLGRINHIA